MGVDFYPCDFCGNVFCDVGHYVSCAGDDCYRRWCSEDCAKSDGWRRGCICGRKYDVYVDEEEITERCKNCENYEYEDLDDLSSCKYCRQEEAYDSELLEFSLSLLNMSREQLVKLMYEGQKPGD